MTLSEVAILIFGIMVSIIGYLGKAKVARMDNDIYGLKVDMKEFKDNYLDRFEKINNNIADSKLEILDHIHKMEIRLTKPK